MTFEFNSKYGLDIAGLDKDHLTLFHLIFLFEACKRKKFKVDSAVELLRKIIELAAIHFEAEEGLLEEYGFPDLENHKKEHERLLREIGSYAKRFEKAGERVSKKDVLFVNRWMEDHLLNDDMNFKDFLKERGAA